MSANSCHVWGVCDLCILTADNILTDHSLTVAHRVPVTDCMSQEVLCFIAKFAQLALQFRGYDSAAYLLITLGEELIICLWYLLRWGLYKILPNNTQNWAGRLHAADTLNMLNVHRTCGTWEYSWVNTGGTYAYTGLTFRVVNRCMFFSPCIGQAWKTSMVHYVQMQIKILQQLAGLDVSLKHYMNEH